ncbi:MAG: hypothetical protein ACJ72E_02000 [Marmoricola sp.]
MLVNRLALLAGAAATSIVLTGCAPTGDTAIKVGATTYTDKDVSLLTSFECSIAKDPSAQVTPLSREAARTFMATVLVQAAIDERISSKSHVKPTEADVASTMTQLDPYITKAASGKDRDRLRSLIESSVLGQLAVGALVQTELGQSLSSMDQSQASQVVADGMKQVRANEAKSTKITIDPVFGLSSNGLSADGADPSLSTALSTFSKAAASTQPDQSWLDALPAKQKCS